jgi:uncharacterized protein
METYEPVSERERLQTLDVLRGAALLGILLMNIVTFGLPLAAYNFPVLWGGADGANLWAFVVQWIFFEGKMRALFSMMFGAGVVVFMERALARNSGVGAADLYSRRMLWLMLFGALHGWLIWYGDILYSYGLCGLLIFPLRNVAPKKLFVAGAIGLLLAQGMLLGMGLRNRSLRDASVAARAAERQGATLTEEQREARKAWDETWNAVRPSKETMQKEIDAYRGGYFSSIAQRVPIMRKFNFIPVYMPGLADMWGMMLIGMGLVKLGVLRGQSSLRTYVWMAAIGYGVGLPLNALSAYGMISSNFEIVAAFLWNAPYHVGRAATALAHAAVLIIVVKQGMVPWLTSRLAAIGQTAFSNYIATSIICAVIFYRPGFGLIGQLERHQLYYVVLGVWAFNLAWSPWWLRRFRFGPLEWCWRSLTYWRRQPMRREVRVAAADVATPAY